MTERIETIIVGGGQAGLSISYYLSKLGRDHLILEREDRVAEIWRNRWDSFTLITPNWMTRLPGAEYQGDDPNGFMVRDDLVTYFEEYLERFELPIRYGVNVTSIEPLEAGYLVRTEQEEFEAANVVMAVGLHQEARIPAFSEKFPTGIDQIHSSQYRNPEDLSSGDVLVVGSAQSGCQIAEELYQSGRKVFLSVGKAGRLPRRYRGKDITKWMSEIGFGDRTVDKLPSPQDKFAGSAHGTGKDGGHTINLHQFVKDGVVLLGRIESVAGDRIIMASDLKDNLEKADKFETFIVNEIDKFIEENGLDAPVEHLIELRDGYHSEEILELDLMSADIRNVVWATGFKFDFGQVKLPVFDEDGYPIQKRGVSEIPGLYFIGLPFLHTSKSGLLAGVGDDAAHVVEQIAARI